MNEAPNCQEGDSPHNTNKPQPVHTTPRRNSLLTLSLELPGDLEALLRDLCRTWEHGEITKTHLAIEALGCLGLGIRENHRALKEGK